MRVSQNGPITLRFAVDGALDVAISNAGENTQAVTRPKSIYDPQK